MPPPDKLATRFAFLASAGEILSSSLNLDDTLQEVARLAIPVLGDLCLVDLVDDRVLRRVATAHVDEHKARLLEELRARYPPSHDSPQPAGHVLRTGELQLLERVTPDVVAAHTRGEDHAQLIRAIGIRSHLAVPLVARGTVLGVISLGISESDRTYGHDDVPLVQDLARRAALAIDNARLYELAQTELAERRRAQEALQVSEERFRAMFEQSPLSTQLLSPDGKTARVNAAWENLWGLTLEHLAGYNMLADPQLEATGIAPLIRRAFAGEPVFLPTIRYDPKETIPEPGRYEDSVRWVSAFAYPVKDAAGEVREVVLVHQDVTELQNAYEQLRVEGRRKDEFLATLAHELRNPLAPIRTGLALLRTDRDADTAERTRQIMERQLAHMVRLIDDLLDLSRVSRGTVHLEKERTDLLLILGTALEASRPVLDDAGVSLIVRLPEEPVIVDADRTRMAQVVSNILNNAAKFTERGGRVELTASVQGSDVHLAIMDTGAGIPAEMLTQIFEMFVQVRDARVGAQPGLGIGLTLVRRLVELHGGRVWAESAGPGRGSTFFVSLPTAAQTAAVGQPADAPVSASAASRRVLVVDDNIDAAETLGMLLSLEGHDVRTAASGTEALGIIARFRPQVALLDIGMPGMSGYDLARQLRLDPQLPDLVLVAVTGWGQDEDRRRSRNAGFDEHLTKPVDPAAVLAIVARS